VQLFTFGILIRIQHAFHLKLETKEICDRLLFYQLSLLLYPNFVCDFDRTQP